MFFIACYYLMLRSGDMKKMPVIFGLVFVSLLIIPSLSSGDSAKYFYDDLGRLTRVVKGTVGTIYNYDELGNLISVTSSTTSTSSPVISGITPNVLFVGSKMLVTISGQNLLTTESVVSTGGLIGIGNIQVTDTRITVEVTALSPGSDAVKVTTQNGTPNYATVGVTLSSSKLTFSPGQLAISPGASGIITASISPPLSTPLTVNLNSSAPSIATVPPSVIIPVSGSATLTVNAIKEGTATVSSGDTKTVVFVNSYTPTPGEVIYSPAKPVSVYIEPQNSIRALPVSTSVSEMSSSRSLPVSVSVGEPSSAHSLSVSAIISEPASAGSLPVSAYIERDVMVVSGLVSVAISSQ